MHLFRHNTTTSWTDGLTDRNGEIILCSTCYCMPMHDTDVDVCVKKVELIVRNLYSAANIMFSAAEALTHISATYGNWQDVLNCKQQQIRDLTSSKTLMTIPRKSDVWS